MEEIIQELCEGCNQYRILKKRKEDGKLLCKRCSKNKCLRMWKTPGFPAK